MRQVFTVPLIIILLLGNATFAFPEEGLQSHGILISLDDALKSALKEHDGIQLLHVRREKEAALEKYAKKANWPKLRSNVYGAAVTQTEPGVLFWTNEIAITVFDGWKARSESRIHALKQNEIELQVKSENQKIQFEVRQIYIQILAEREMTLLAQDWLKESRKIFRSFKELYEKELITKREVYHAEALYKAAQYELINHKEAMDYGVTLMRDILKLSENIQLQLEPLMEITRAKRDFSQFEKNPIYEAAKIRLQEKEEEQKIARSGLFPQISVLNRYRIAKDSFLDQNRYEFGLEGKWNIWDFGQTNELVKAKKFEALEVKLQSRIEIKEFEERIKKMQGQAVVEWKKIQSEKSVFKEKKEAYENEKTKLIVNEAGRVQVFEAYQDYLKARIHYIQSLSDFRILQAQLDSMKEGFAV